MGGVGAFILSPTLDSFAWTFNLIFYLVYVDVLENKDWTASFVQVYVVGEDGILEELKLAGFECFGGSVRLVILCLHFSLSRTRTRAAKRKKRGEPRVIQLGACVMPIHRTPVENCSKKNKQGWDLTNILCLHLRPLPLLDTCALV